MTDQKRDVVVPVAQPAGTPGAGAFRGAELDEDLSAKSEESCLGIMCSYLIIGLCCILALIPLFWPFYFKVVNQYQRLVHFRLGKLVRPAKGPGIFFFIPLVDTWMTVDLRIRTIEVKRQEMMTRDSVTCTVDAVVYFHVCEPGKSVNMVTDAEFATSNLAQTTLRSIIGESELDELLSKRDALNRKIKVILDQQTHRWGVEVTTVEIRDVVLPQAMQRAMASQAEAERERRAKVISAEGELQASKSLFMAAEQMTKNSATMQLRYLQTLTQISTSNAKIIAFPLPLDMGSLFRPAAALPAVAAVARAAFSEDSKEPVLLPGAVPGLA